MAGKGRRKPSGGRATPPARRGAPPTGRAPALRPASRRGFDPAQPFQVGRRPSSPYLLLVVGLMWIAAGLVALFALTAGWRFVPAVAFAGIGLYFVRGSSATILRRERRQGR